MLDNTSISNSERLLKDIIQYYYAKTTGNNGELLLMNNWNFELFQYSFTKSTIEILEEFLNNRRTLSETIRFSYLTLWKLFDAGECDLLYLLLKYNILDIKILDEYPKVRYDDSEQQSNDKLIAWQHGREFLIRRNMERLYDLHGLFPLLNNLYSYNSHSYRRLRKILWGVMSIIKDDVSGVPVHQKVQCLKIIYNFIREPYITSAEVYDILKFLAEKNYRENHIENVREVFEDNFPESELPYQPRSLKYLSRWRIQQSLRDVGMFPGGVARLGLPKSLTTFILSEKPSMVYREAPHFVKYDNNVYDKRLERGMGYLIFKL